MYGAEPGGGEVYSNSIVLQGTQGACVQLSQGASLKPDESEAAPLSPVVGQFDFARGNRLTTLTRFDRHHDRYRRQH